MLPPTSTETAPPEGAHCAIHPERPAHAKCSSCGAYACSPCSTVHANGRVTCAACEAKAPSVLPWEQRKTMGYGRAIARTIAGVLLHPYAFFGDRTREQSLWPTLLLGLAFHLVGQIAQTITNLAFLDQTRAELLADPVGRMMPWLASREYVIGELVASPIAFFVSTFAVAGLWCLGLKIVGGLRRPYHVVVRALCYVQAVSILVPVIAPIAHLGPAGTGFALAFGLWATTIQIVAVSRMQGIEVVRGFLAFLLWIGLASLALCALATVLLWSVASQIQLPS